MEGKYKLDPSLGWGAQALAALSAAPSRISRRGLNLAASPAGQLFGKPWQRTRRNDSDGSSGQSPIYRGPLRMRE
jgi:hypothetical protein